MHDDTTDLWDIARGETVPVLREINEILEGTGEADRAEKLIGNQSLGTGLNWHDNYKLLHNRPLPLPELLDNLYLELNGTPAANLLN